jgi:uncharacterized membrane protein
MSPDKSEKFLCPVCGLEKQFENGTSGQTVAQPVALMIRQACSDWSQDQITCVSCLNEFAAKYVQQILEAQRGELSALEQEVISSLTDQELLSRDLNVEYESNLTLGQRIADTVTRFGGSWTFLGVYCGLLALWVAINTFHMIFQAFDPYPFIFLNLVLSGLATLQAPIILMSQNRQDARDRMRSQHDYSINLKAELEIRHLNSKMDQLLTKQWARLLEIQGLQMEMLNAINSAREVKPEKKQI